MTDINIFEQAARKRLRFNTPKGNLSTEDLWDMPLSGSNGFNLDQMAINLHNKVKDAAQVSFVDQQAAVDPTEELRFEIVKYVIKVKLVKRDEAVKARDLAEKKQKILALMAKKKDEALEDFSLEELEEMLAKL